MTPSAPGRRRALLLDYGGVLTAPVGASFAAFERQLGIPEGRSFELLLAASRDAGGGPIGALERGELALPDFEAELTSLLHAAGHRVPDGLSLLDGLFAAMQPAGPLWDVAARARENGIRTGLLSNSWGDAAYPFERLEQVFDELVLSGREGLRKPDPAIYRLAADRVGVAVEDCVFVDDLPRNVEVAAQLGMTAIHHADDGERTRQRIEAALELPTG